MTTVLDTLSAKLSGIGLIIRGGFQVEEADGAPKNAQTILVIGNSGPEMWKAMGSSMSAGADPMNKWTAETITPIAKDLGAQALYPFGEPPYYPFQRWAKRAEDVHSSPLGILIHPEYGLWHAYRAAMCFDSKMPLPPRKQRPSPCDTCMEKPCLTTCPVGAFSVQSGYNVPLCADYLKGDEGRPCMSYGCAARRACPVGRDFHYTEDQAAFHMKAFLAAQS